MFNYIKADLYRIFHKRSNQLYWLILAGLFLTFVIFGSENANFADNKSELTELYFSVAVMPLVLFGPLIISPQFYYAVYLDELNSKSFVRLFSSGLRKSEYIVVKLISSLVYMLVVFLFLAVAYVGGFGIIALLNNGASFFTLDQIGLLLSLVAYLGLFTIAFSSLTNLITLKLQSGNISLFLFFVFSNGVIASVIGWLNRLPILRNFDFNPYLLSTNIGEIQTALTNGIFYGQQGQPSNQPPSAQAALKMINSIGVQPFIIIGIYIIATTMISFFILKRSDVKEN
ncbi:ABC transporter permease subunit [Tetragenococcus koreensis]|uniref:ABC transporter permease subunit n=1 Tax=Tetragenococcus koreensis TaxID=290335 RepID=UPI001F345E1B|nr:ABC transporter permease subunit [Tetragenococcus koreensis]MCF1585049.1 ABC transporter permease subunit [Tetragenococcus koreensis]MCF1614612.1 ABC transporter permease subunit [Tetragenococcus koreensis]MCF1619436.1 ABC transporter permease subunit [Tetragenococcus koreensis]MCF1624395.1 ABC transporter permease subunit [Tetragenococcus koreensis]MCF1627298.1 ABC transporter permease subunit [Tetragenococcus koreensis]